VVAYAGLVPRRSRAGERDASGYISKAGDPMLRKAIYEAAIRPSSPGQESGQSQRCQAPQNGRRAKACRMTPLTLAERDRVPLGLSPAPLVPISRAKDNLVRKVGGSTSLGTQRRPPMTVRTHKAGSAVR
jgi:hypothetical protein